MANWRVTISPDGFSHCNLAVEKNDIVEFDWSLDTASEQFCVTQIVQSEEGIFAVPNGVSFDIDLKCHFQWRPRLTGTFNFVCSSSSFVLSVTVDNKKLFTPLLQCENDVFTPGGTISVLREDIPVIIQSDCRLLSCEFQFRPDGIFKITRPLKRQQNNQNWYEFPASKSRQYLIIADDENEQSRLCFNEESTNYCIADVQNAPIEHRVSISDSSNKVVSILKGDKIWFSWEKCNIRKSIFQVDLNLNPKEKFFFQRKLTSRFQSDLESVSGLCCYEFPASGFFHFATSENSSQIISVEVVEPPRAHQLKFGPQIQCNGGDLVDVEVGDYIKFIWDKTVQLTSQFVHASECLPKMTKKQEIEPDDAAEVSLLSKAELDQVGQLGEISVRMNRAGVFSYSLYPLCPVAVTIVVRHPNIITHYIDLDDNSDDRRILKISPSDFVVFQWNSSRTVSLAEISPQGKTMKRGFKSGPAKMGPAIFVHQFLRPGVHYYLDKMNPKIYGMIVVGETRPQIVRVPVLSDVSSPGVDANKCTFRQSEEVNAISALCTGKGSIVQAANGDVIVWMTENATSESEFGPLDNIGTLPKKKHQNAIEYIPK